jgi:DNA-binding CsgD family transcriptional regulator
VPALRAAVLAEFASNMAVSGVERLPEAEALALEALEQAPPGETVTERHASLALAWSRAVRGSEIDDLAGRVDDTGASLFESVGRIASVQLAWRGQVDEAREELAALARLADERGEERSYAALRVHLCEVELRAGDCNAASRLLDEWGESAGTELFMAPAYERCRALLAAGRGDLQDASRWVSETLARAEETGVRWDLLEGLRAGGLSALLAHDTIRAVESFVSVWDHTRREGVDDPGVFPVAPDLVEALVEAGEQARAHEVVERLAQLAEQQTHPWGLAGARRCGALVQLAGGTYDERAAAALEEAATAYEALGLRFDRARSLLALGRARRRFRKWGAARDSLEQAAAAFDELGSPGWADQARSELTRIGARKPKSGGLTPSERRAAELAASGKSNKEIAQELVVSVYTVERHLSRAYAKLGIRSRAQLAGRLAEDKSVQVSGI